MISKINYNTLPYGLRLDMKLYVEDKIKPGYFLTAALEDKFVSTCYHVNDIYIDCLPDIAHWIYNELPSSIWGSKEKVDTHLSSIVDLSDYELISLVTVTIMQTLEDLGWPDSNNKNEISAKDTYEYYLEDTGQNSSLNNILINRINWIEIEKLLCEAKLNSE